MTIYACNDHNLKTAQNHLYFFFENNNNQQVQIWNVFEKPLQQNTTQHIIISWRKELPVCSNFRTTVELVGHNESTCSWKLW